MSSFVDLLFCNREEPSIANIYLVAESYLLNGRGRGLYVTDNRLGRVSVVILQRFNVSPGSITYLRTHECQTKS